jgi:hypothetical protein
MRHREHHRDRAPEGASVRTAGPRFPAMTRPALYRRRMIVFLAVIASVLLMLHAQAVQFFLRNPPLNTLILSLLAVGIALSFRAVSSLDREVAWIERYRHDDPRVLEGGSPLLGPLAAVLEEPGRRSSLTATSLRSILDGIESRLDERRDTSRYLIGLLIFLGLLGTFWGLLMTANSVGETIRGLSVVGSDPAQMFETLRTGLEAPLAGMGTAFSTSLFGLASSLVLGFLDLQVSQAQNRFANDLETRLTGLVPVEGDIVVDQAAPAPSYVTALLQHTAENLGELERRMVRLADDNASLQAALRTLGDRLGGLADELHTRNSLVDPAAEAQRETRAVLERIASVLERQGGGLDEATRTHLKSLAVGIGRLIEDGARERDRAVTEIRNEIRLLARTLSVIADRER